MMMDYQISIDAARAYKPPFNWSHIFIVIELFLNTTLCEWTLCETSVRDAPGTESNNYLPHSFAERYMYINSCLIESCTDCLLLFSP